MWWHNRQNCTFSFAEYNAIAQDYLLGSSTFDATFEQACNTPYPYNQKTFVMLVQEGKQTENISFHKESMTGSIQTSLTLPFLIEVPVPSHESERLILFFNHTTKRHLLCWYRKVSMIIIRFCIISLNIDVILSIVSSHWSCLIYFL
jgi:hypothetical protein